MTVRQRQCLLCYLGYYDSGVDGIWGARSQAAAAAFCRDREVAEDMLEAELLSAITLGTNWWQQIRYFSPEEFACKCGGAYCDGYPAQMSQVLVKTADQLRQHFDVPVYVSSGLRCGRHNANVGGVAGSRHLSGNAMDFRVEGKTARQILDYLQEQPQLRYFYAIDDEYVHMDV